MVSILRRDIASRYCAELTRICPPSQCPSTASASLTPASGGSSRWRSDMVNPAKNTICLWYDGDAEDAARFYAKTFPDSSVGAVHRAPGDFPSGKKGDVLTVEFTVMGIPCLGLNGGPAFKHNEAFSFQVATADQAETDRYWNAIVGNGGEESACGWCKDKWGLSWQITPDRSDPSDHRSRSRRRQARVRCDDADEKDRHRRNRGGAPRLRLHLGSVHLGSAENRCPARRGVARRGVSGNSRGNVLERSRVPAA